MSQGPDDDILSLYELVRDGEARKLIRYLQNSQNPQTRAKAAQKLGDLAARSGGTDDTEIISALVTAVLEDEHGDVRTQAIDSLDQYGREAIDQLITEIGEFDAGQTPDWLTRKKLVRWLDSDDVEFQMVAASALGRIGDEHVIPHLVDVFDDLDPRVRERAVSACGRIGHPRAIGPVSNRLTDSEGIVQQAAADALTRIGTKKAIGQLIPAARADNKQVRYIAVSELGQLRNTKPLAVLVEALTDESVKIRHTATLSLIELLVADIAADSEVRQAVTREMRPIDDTELIERLLDIFADTTRIPIKRIVIWLLGQVIHPQADDVERVYETLLGLLDVEPLADQAVDSLAELESEALEDRLLTFTKRQNPSSEAKERAEALLDQIDTSRIDETVRDSVEYTYVQDPADYTRQKENEVN